RDSLYHTKTDCRSDSQSFSNPISYSVFTVPLIAAVLGMISVVILVRDIKLSSVGTHRIIALLQRIDQPVILCSITVKCVADDALRIGKQVIRILDRTDTDRIGIRRSIV